MIEEKEYSYETSRSASAALIFFGMFVLIFGPVWAINNDTGITVFYIELNTRDATIFYWLYVPIGLLLLTIGVMGNLERSKWKPYLTINDKGILLPVKPWKKERKCISFRGIEDIKFKNIRGKEFLYIKEHGLSYVISEVKLKVHKHFEEIAQLVMNNSPQLQNNIELIKRDRESNGVYPVVIVNGSWGAIKRYSVLTGIGVVVFIIVLLFIV